MKHSLLMLAATAALGMATVTQAAAEQPRPPTAPQTMPPQAQAPAPAEKKGFFGDMKEWFSEQTDNDARNSAGYEPAAGSETQQPKARRATPAYNQTNPVAGRIVKQGGESIGVRTNAKVGKGAGGSYGNE